MRSVEALTVVYMSYNFVTLVDSTSAYVKSSVASLGSIGLIAEKEPSSWNVNHPCDIYVQISVCIVLYICTENPIHWHL